MFINFKIKKQNKSNGSRHKKEIQKNLLSKTNLLSKINRKTILSNAGRNLTGRITIRHKGSGGKKKIFYINHENNFSTSITVCICLDTKKTSFIALNFDLKDKKFWNITASQNTCSGSLIKNVSTTNEHFSSFFSFLINFPTGVNIFNVSSTKNKICYAKAAGSFCTLLQKQKQKILLRLPSGKIIKLPITSFGIVGKVSNKLNKQQIIGKAGLNRIKGKRPSVRGVAMNPVDHPHGGNTSGGTHPKTPWGVPTIGKHTSKKIYGKI